MAKPVLGYWDVRGAGEPIRLMLEYCEVDYEDKRYVSGTDGNIQTSHWFSVKFKLGLDFPNLPYYIDGDTKLTERLAIMKYIGRKYNLMPTNEKEIQKCEMSEGVVSDIALQFGMVCYEPEKNKQNFFDVFLPLKLDQLNTFLGRNTWLSGEVITYIDFMSFVFFDYICAMEPSVLDKYENIKACYKKFWNFEKVVAYRQSKRFKKFPIAGKMAKWGSNEEE